ncbi:MAG: hypothetical protein IPG76_06900 [Acidobacteria bacterium]|nr:hypothetical protein [Acidobacteriota bacterium]
MNQTPLQTLLAYVHAFESLRADEVISFYELPCTFIRPDGVWIVQDEATALVLANHLIDHAKGQGYRKTEVCEIAMRTLAPELIELNGVFIRYGESQAELARFGFTYILHGNNNEWKIVVAVAHSAVTATTLLSPAAGE